MESVPFLSFWSCFRAPKCFDYSLELNRDPADPGFPLWEVFKRQWSCVPFRSHHSVLCLLESAWEVCVFLEPWPFFQSSFTLWHRLVHNLLSSLKLFMIFSFNTFSSYYLNSITAFFHTFSNFCIVSVFLLDLDNDLPILLMKTAHFLSLGRILRINYMCFLGLFPGIW